MVVIPTGFLRCPPYLARFGGAHKWRSCHSNWIFGGPLYLVRVGLSFLSEVLTILMVVKLSLALIWWDLVLLVPLEHHT
jgi:hypothetical protein